MYCVCCAWEGFSGRGCALLLTPERGLPSLHKINSPSNSVPREKRQRPNHPDPVPAPFPPLPKTPYLTSPDLLSLRPALQALGMVFPNPSHPPVAGGALLAGVIGTLLYHPGL